MGEQHFEETFREEKSGSGENYDCYKKNSEKLTLFGFGGQKIASTVLT